MNTQSTFSLVEGLGQSPTRKVIARLVCRTATLVWFFAKVAGFLDPFAWSNPFGSGSTPHHGINGLPAIVPTPSIATTAALGTTRGRKGGSTLDDDAMTSSEGEPNPKGGKTAKKPRADKEARAVDLYEQTSSPTDEAAPTEARESPDSEGTLGGVEHVEGFDEAQVLQEALTLAESVPVTPELEALPDAGEIEFGPLPAPETICGADDRVRISPATAIPWRWNCQLLITMANGGGSRCTGWLIGPRTLMTAGHCVFSHSAGGWARQIEVVPGMDAASRPFGSQVSRTLRSVTGWTGSANPEYDYGAIILPTATNLGYFGFASLPDADLRGMIGNNAGYPGDKPFGTQWFNADPISEVTARRLGYMIDTMGGQSGSAVWRVKDGVRHAVGIHGYGGCPNRAVRIISPVFNNMVAWKNV